VTDSSGAILARLTRLHPKRIDLSLGRVERLLAALGHPERALPPVVHVAGTNGKGSTVATLRAIAEAAGLRAHVYVSPHLVRFHERIRLAGTLIEEGALAHLLEECERANGDSPITFFEITTAAAFLAFARTPADILLLEVGLGGRLDATNVVESPALAVITPVSLDHQQFLGDTVGAIAGEKSGILKRGIPCVVAPQVPEAAAAIAQRADIVNASLLRHGREWTVQPTPAGIVYRSAACTWNLPRPGLPGAHQIVNAGAAAAAAEALSPRFGFTPGHVAQGVARVEWPARLQRLTRGPLAEKMPAGWSLWLDGGHNPSAGEAISQHMDSEPDAPWHLVIGMLTTKDAPGFLAPLARRAASLSTVPVPGAEAGFEATALAEAARGAGAQARAYGSAAGAIGAILAAPGRPGRILICGSLYLAGAVLAENG
jgi:dihydrofolate synthase/folylpolyglutamate synthase